MFSRCLDTSSKDHDRKLCFLEPETKHKCHKIFIYNLLYWLSSLALTGYYKISEYDKGMSTVFTILLIISTSLLIYAIVPALYWRLSVKISGTLYMLSMVTWRKFIASFGWKIGTWSCKAVTVRRGRFCHEINSPSKEKVGVSKISFSVKLFPPKIFKFSYFNLALILQGK